MQDDSTIKKTRVRSRDHPKVPASECVDLARRVRDYGGSMSVADYATALNYSSHTTGAAVSKVASPTYFGLLKREGDALRTTQLLQRLLAPESNEEEQVTKLEALRQVTIYNDLLEAIGRTGRKEDRVVENIAQRRLGIAPQAARQFVDVFVESAVWAGIGRRVDDGSFELWAEPSAEGPVLETPGEGDEAPGIADSMPAPKQAGQERETPRLAELKDVHVHIHVGSGESLADLEDKIKAVLRGIGLAKDDAQ